jgi:hypothetical protein
MWTDGHSVQRMHKNTGIKICLVIYICTCDRFQFWNWSHIPTLWVPDCTLWMASCVLCDWQCGYSVVLNVVVACI